MNSQSEIKDIYQHILDAAGYHEDIRYLHSSLPHWYPYFINRLFEIEVFVTDVLQSTEAGFELQTRVVKGRSCTTRRPYLVALKLAKHFKAIWNFIIAYRDEYRYSLNVELFFQCCMQINLGRELFSDPCGESSIPGKFEYEIFNDLVDQIRLSANSSEYKSKKKTIHDKFRRRYRDYADYINGLFQQYARLLVIRVDLSYDRKHAALVTEEQAKADFNKFLHRFRRSQYVHSHCVGYIWKMEFGAEKGYHFHCFYFYNEQKKRNDYFWGQKIGELWNNTVSNGLYWNCNTTQHKADFEKHGKLGIGKIHRGDFKARDNLNVILQYLIKSEQYLLATTLSDDPRLIGRGL